MAISTKAIRAAACVLARAGKHHDSEFEGIVEEMLIAAKKTEQLK